MSTTKTTVCLAAALAAAALAAPLGCKKSGFDGSGREGGGVKSIRIDGSSTVFPTTEAVAEEFQAQSKGTVHVTVGISGTGGGFKKFVRNEIDIADASRPILKAEMDSAKQAGIEFIELPVCFDALTVIVHPSNTFAATMTVADLKKVWEPEAQEKVLYWDQVRPEWPHEKLVLFGAGTDSGTFDYFTEAINGKAKACRGDFTGSEDDNVLIQGVAGNKHALGFIPYAYYATNTDKVKAVGVDAGKGPVLPSPENVLNATYSPLSRPLFIYVNRKSAERPEVKEFVEFYLKHAPQLTQEVKYLPLPDSAYEKCLQRLAKLETGSAFGGVPEVGLHVDEILAREPKH